MKLRTKIHGKYRISIENMDVFSLLIDSNKFKNSKQFIISLLNNKINNQQKETNKMLKIFIENASNHYSNKLSFFQASTKQILDYNGEVSLLPEWYDKNGKISNYYIQNIIDDSLKRDLMLLGVKKQIKSNYKFELLDFDNIFRSLSTKDNDDIIDKKSQLFLFIKVIFFILIIIAIILMILFFII